MQGEKQGHVDSQGERVRRQESTRRFARRAWHLVFIALACLALVQGTAAFAIKYHFDLTENALQIEGFEGNSIGLVQSYNWMDDLAEQSGSTGFQGSAIKTLVYRGSGAMIQGSDISMHFDDLMDYSNVSAEWMRLENQTYAAVKEAERTGDVEGFLAVMGMSLHTVQDFYSHSNWVERDWGGDATWYDIPESRKLEGEIYTGTKGDRGHDVINKDYTSRPDFEPAYRDAFYASLQWTELMRSWVSPEFWERARTFAHNSGSGRRFADAAMRGNWYAGTWNSDTSLGEIYGRNGLKNYFEILVMEGIPDQIPESTYERWDTYGRIVTASPSAPSKHPQEYAYIPTYNWLRVTTYEIHQTDQDSWDIEPWGEADFYPKIRVNGQYYYEDPIMDQDHAYLQWVIADQYVHPWFTLVPLPEDQDRVGISYEVYDDDGLGRGDDDLCDINPEKGKEAWTYSGPGWEVRDLPVDTNGFRGCKKYGSCKVYCWGCFQSIGDGDEARAKFHINFEYHARTSQYTPEVQPPPNSPPSAYFTLSTISGYPPLPLVITDVSTGNPTSWSWTFTGPISAAPGPIKGKTLPAYTLDQPGKVTITLTVSNAYGSSSVTRTVTVTGSAPIADFYLSPAFGTEPLDVTIYDSSIGIPATWEWTIESPDQSPQKVYQKELPGLNQLGAGTHRITLTVGNAYGSSSRTRTVTVLPADTAEPPGTCPDGCTCTEADLPGVERCSDTPCGVVGGKTYYCTRAIPFVNCEGCGECLLEADAIQKFGDYNNVPQRCSSSLCGSAGGLSKYCYRQGTVTCPAGYQCINPTGAGWNFIEPTRYSDTVCGYSHDPDTPSERTPEYCYREGHVVS